MKIDFLDYSEPEYLPKSDGTGYYNLNLEPAELMKYLGKALQNKKLSKNKRLHLKKLFSSIDENDNNYILCDKLKKDFSSEKPNEALLFYNESLLEKKTSQ